MPQIGQLHVPITLIPTKVSKSVSGSQTSILLILEKKNFENENSYTSPSTPKRLFFEKLYIFLNLMRFVI